MATVLGWVRVAYKDQVNLIFFLDCSRRIGVLVLSGKRKIEQYWF